PAVAIFFGAPSLSDPGEVVGEGKDDEPSQYGEADALKRGLGLERKGLPAYALEQREKHVAAVQDRNRKQVHGHQGHADEGSEGEKLIPSASRLVAGDLRERDRS